MKKLACATIIAASAALTVAPAAQAVPIPSWHGCTYRIAGKGVHAACNSNVNHTTTGNLYVVCARNWPNPHVRKTISPYGAAYLNTRCGGWSHPTSASAWLS